MSEPLELAPEAPSEKRLFACAQGCGSSLQFYAWLGLSQTAARSTRLIVPGPHGRCYLLISDSLGCASSWRLEARDFVWGLSWDRGTGLVLACEYPVACTLRQGSIHPAPTEEMSIAQGQASIAVSGASKTEQPHSRKNLRTETSGQTSSLSHHARRRLLYCGKFTGQPVA